MSLACNILVDRAKMLSEARAFFAKRNVLEVDCGALVRCAPLDANIDVIPAQVSDHESGFLHTSPEYAMKRLLASGLQDIYFLGHVYRYGEMGPRHHPEFTMAEWYRSGITFAEMIRETAEFLFLFFGTLPIRMLSYKDAFKQYVPADVKTDPRWDRDTTLHYLLSHYIEPKLGQDELTVLTDYPPHEAALACTVEKNGEIVAERFEIYYQGVELTNGYHELSDAEELRCRFEEINHMRVKQGKAPYALDEKFLSAIENLPECCGVSVGFDRAMMLRHNLQNIQEVLHFHF